LSDRIWIIIGVVVVGLIYFLPSFIAARRHAQRTSGIILLNLFLGLTALGWLAALIWAVSAHPESAASIAVRNAEWTPYRALFAISKWFVIAAIFGCIVLVLMGCLALALIIQHGGA